METVVLWCSFVGTWLLFFGAVYQSTLELRNELAELNKFGSARERYRPESTVSPWWWLIPPVKIILTHRNTNRHKKLLIASMPETEVHAVVSFANKANGWLLVAVGGFLLALKETYELDQGLDKPLIWLWIVIILFPVLAVIYTASGVARGEKLLKQANDKKPTSTK